ncbi:hypothetical protein EC973_001989 [Apophysomyces ossiformis]|uniref:Uncharacterized protein n=1 Tax=Apophysomyces ossiformis TaxID=679940 RepID=A0A8H7ERJ0_9FUNG|nr:hypothetical protein EC973_001989 [Apophysomyces ossiformis]
MPLAQAQTLGTDQQRQQFQHYPSVQDAALRNDKIPANTASAYKRHPEEPLLWFAGPPVNVTPLSRPVHSLAYLNWKQAQK